MLPFSIGFYELVVIFTVLLLVVGPKGIPQLARTIGGWVRMARRTMRELQDVMLDADVKAPLVKPWEEVVKARDKALESVLALDEDVIDAEVATPADTNDCESERDVSQSDTPEMPSQLVKPRVTAVPATGTSRPIIGQTSESNSSESEDG